MRKRLGAVTALICLIAAGAAGAAYAAGPVTGGPNTYTGAMSVAGGAGTRAKPATVALTENYGMGSTTSGNVGAPLVVIKSRMYGLAAPNAKYFATCTANKINQGNGNNGKWNGVCPKASLVGRGTVLATLTSPTVNLAGPGASCNLVLWVYNGGPGKLTYFFTTTPARCDGLQTGAAAAWTGTVSQAGKYLVTNTPEPPDVSYNAGNVGLFGSLVSEVVKFKKATVKHAGKTLPFIESIGCSKHARPFTITYTATDSNSGSPTVGSGTVSGSARC
ncbi:MAG: hypothetical protein ACRDLT_14555 [Solirubrobacteraceae bacterium]